MPLHAHQDVGDAADAVNAKAREPVSLGARHGFGFLDSEKRDYTNHFVFCKLCIICAPLGSVGRWS